MRKAHPLPLLAALLVTSIVSGCDTHNEPDLGRSGPTGFRVTIEQPTALGSLKSPISATHVVYDVQAMSASPSGSSLDTAFSGPVSVYAWFEDTLSPPHDGGGAPLATVMLVNGVALKQAIDLPPVYGPTVLWVEDVRPATGFGSYATGASPTLWYPNPLIYQARTPKGTLLLDLNTDALLGKEVTFSRDTPGSGDLIVTAVFSESFNVMDLAHPDYGGIDVYAFSVPTVQVGSRIQTMTGALEEFNGYSELDFPTYQAAPIAPDPSLVTPFVIDNKVFQNFACNVMGVKCMKALEGELVEIDGGKVCPFPPYDPTNPSQEWTSWQKYGQWTLDAGVGCGLDAGVPVESGTTVTAFDPTQPAVWGQPVPQVIGIAQNVFIAKSGTDFYLLVPRGQADIVCDFKGCAGH